jgi:hypothetical protein
MKSYIITTENFTLDTAFHELFTLFAERHGDLRYDFVLIALPPQMATTGLEQAVETVADPNRVCVFHAVEAPCFEPDVSRIVALFIVFERQGYVDCHFEESFDRHGQAVERTLRYLNRHADAFHLMFVTAYHHNVSRFIDTLSKRSTSPIKIVGGVCAPHVSDQYQPQELYHGGRTTEQGFLIVSLHRVQSHVETAMGFKPMGVRYVVSKVEDDRILEVDDGLPFPRIVAELADGIEPMQTEYLRYTPVILLDNEGARTINLRTFRRIREEDVAFYGPIETGQKIKLSYGESHHLLQASEKAARRMAIRMPACDLVFNFSCVFRQYVLEEKAPKECETYQNALGAPVFSMFSHGEIGTDSIDGRLRFYNETSILAGLAEA